MSEQPQEVEELDVEEAEAEVAPEGDESVDNDELSEDAVWAAVAGEEVDVPDDEAADDQSTKEA